MMCMKEMLRRMKIKQKYLMTFTITTGTLVLLFFSNKTNTHSEIYLNTHIEAYDSRSQQTYTSIGLLTSKKHTVETKRLTTSKLVIIKSKTVVRGDVQTDALIASRVGNSSSQFKKLVAIRKKVKDDESKYFKLRKAKVNPIDSSFIIENKLFCEHESEHPYLITVVPSKPGDLLIRDVIRKTLGSYGFGTNADQLRDDHNVTMKVLFILGSGSSEDVDKLVMEESVKHGDIIQAKFTDSYRNLTKKMLISLKWIVKQCANIEYVLKLDTDVYVNIPLLIPRLKSQKSEPYGTILGFIYPFGLVKRQGKWKVTVDEFPLNKYPSYASGNAYVLSGNLVPRLVYAAEHLPYMPIEDAFITGCLAQVTSAKLVRVSGFSQWTDPKPDPCTFFKRNKITGTKVTPDLMHRLWDVQNQFRKMCSPNSFML